MAQQSGIRSPVATRSRGQTERTVAIDGDGLQAQLIQRGLRWCDRAIMGGTHSEPPRTAAMTIEGLDLSQLLLVLAVIGAGATLQGAIGFGLALVAAPVLALVDPAFVPGPILAISVPLSLGVLRRERHLVEVATLRWALVGRVAGTLAAVAVLVVVPAERLTVVFAVGALIAVILSTVGWHVEPTTRSLIVAGAASGYMGTTTSIGGPPIALLYQRSRGGKLRTTLGLVLGVGAVISVVGLVAVGSFRGHELVLTLVLAPGVALGFAASRWFHDVLDRGWVRPLVLAVAAASALTLLAREVL